MNVGRRIVIWYIFHIGACDCAWSRVVTACINTNNYWRGYFGVDNAIQVDTILTGRLFSSFLESKGYIFGFPAVIDERPLPKVPLWGTFGSSNWRRIWGNITIVAGSKHNWKPVFTPVRNSVHLLPTSELKLWLWHIFQPSSGLWDSNQNNKSGHTILRVQVLMSRPEAWEPW